MNRLLIRVATLMVVLAAIMFVPATAASAAPAGSPFGLDCKKAPAPEGPGRGATSMLVEAPKTLPTGPTWANNRPVFEHYAYAGLRWNTYDLGCTGPFGSPDAVVGTGVGNWLLEAPKFLVAVTNFVVDAAYHPTFLQVFDPLVTTATKALQRAVFEQWVMLFVVLTGLLLVWRARRMQMNQALSSAAWVLVVFVVASAVFSWPLKAGHIADQAVTTSLGSVNGAINGTNQDDPAAEVKQNITGAVLYEQWKNGVFGSSDSPTAAKYARGVWEATTLTWGEAKTVSDDPDGAGKKLIEAKNKQYEDIAGKIKNEDPDAYEYFTGKRDARMSSAFVALIAALATCPFLLASSILILAAFLLVRLGVVFFPVIATLAVFEKFRGMLKGLAMTMAAAVVNCIVFGVGTSIAIFGTGVLLSPDTKLNRPLSLVLMALFMFIMWKLLSPARKLTVMMSPNRNLFGDAAGSIGEAGRKTRRTALDLAGKFATSYLGGAVAASKINSKKDPKPEAEPETSAEPETEPSPTGPQVSPPLVLVASPVPVAIDARPAHAESGPHERPPAAEQPRPGLPPAPAPAAPPQTPGISAPAGAPQPQIGTAPASVADTPPITSTDEPTQPGQPKVRAAGDPEERIWMPGDSAAPPTAEPPRVVDPEMPRYDPVVNEEGEEIYPVFDPARQQREKDEEKWW